MADKRISQLIERVDIANNDVLPIVASGATTTNKVTISTIQTWMQDNLDVGVTSVGITIGSTGTDINVTGSPVTSSGNITINIPTASASNRGLLSSSDWTTFNNKLSSVGLTMPSAFTVSNSPLTANGTIAVTGAGTVAQYIRGDGSLADFPEAGGGGASVSYYLNGSVSQGTIGGIAYREMNNTPILGAGTDFTIAANGYIASFITDAGDPNLLLIPGGNWNFETFLSANNNAGNPTFYIELYKVDSGGTATLIASNSATPEPIAFGSTIHSYFSALAVPTTVLTLTDRLALRYYVTHSGRTITMHTENSHLCQVITTFTTGLTALNGLTAQVQNFATGTSGTDFNISSTSATHTFNLPDASASNRGAVTTGNQTFAGTKTFNSDIVVNGVNVGRGGASVPSNTRIGNSALKDNTTGANNTAVGVSSLIFTTTGTSNTAVGHQVLSNANGSLNTAVGVSSLFNLTTGDNNLGLGNQAGNQISGGSNNDTSNNSIFIGTDTKPLGNNQTNQIVIGHQAIGQGSNTVTIGNGSITLNKLFGRVIHADAVNSDESATLGQVNTSLGGYVTLATTQTITGAKTFDTTTSTFALMNSTNANGGVLTFRRNGTNVGHIGNSAQLGGGVLDAIELRSGVGSSVILKSDGGQVTLATGGGVTLTGALNGTSASFSGALTINSNSNSTWAAGINNLGTTDAHGLYVNIGASSTGVPFAVYKNFSSLLTIANSGAATFSSTLQAGGEITTGSVSRAFLRQTAGGDAELGCKTGGTTSIFSNGTAALSLASTGAATFSSSGIANATTKFSVNGAGLISSFGSTGSGTDNYIRFVGNTNNFDVGINGTSWGVADAGVAYRFLITQAGNVGIGTASPGAPLEVRAASGSNFRVRSNGSNNLLLQNYNDSDFYRNIQVAASTIQLLTGTEGGTDATERMRITSGGNVGIGTNNPNGGRLHIADSGADNTGLYINNNTFGHFFTKFSYQGSVVGSISYNGSNTVYTTTSDYRLKENVNPVESALSKLSQLKPCTFNFKSNSDEEVMGFIAHEVQEVIPQAVIGQKDEVRIEQVEISPAELDEEGNVITEAVIQEKEVPVYQGIDHSILVPLLVASIQELKAEIEALKSQING